jgi:hypothetical protein
MDPRSMRRSSHCLEFELRELRSVIQHGPTLNHKTGHLFNDVYGRSDTFEVNQSSSCQKGYLLKQPTSGRIILLGWFKIEVLVGRTGIECHEISEADLTGGPFQRGREIWKTTVTRVPQNRQVHQDGHSSARMRCPPVTGD